MRNRYILLADLALIPVAAITAFVLRFGWRFYEQRPEFVPFLIAMFLLKPVVFYLSGLYGRYWSYASVNDLLLVVAGNWAASLAAAVYVGVSLAIDRHAEFSRGVLLIDALMCLSLTGGVRMCVRAIADVRAQTGRRRRGGAAEKHVLIIGAGLSGTMVAREMQRNPQLNMIPIGFLDDDPTKVGKVIHGLRVFGATRALRDALSARRVDEVAIAMPTAPGSVLRDIADDCRSMGVRPRTIPGVFELLDGQVGISRLRDVEIVDLLRRAPFRSDFLATQYLASQTVLVTGAGGSIGSELCRQIAAAHPARLVMAGHGENSLFDGHVRLRASHPNLPLSLAVVDVRDRTRLMRLFEHVSPAVVFHAAAHKHVPMMEENPEEAISNNVIGTSNVIDAALRVRTGRLVMISTDKAVSPTSIMGASKRVAELVVRDAARHNGAAFAVVRFGNVLGSRGSVVPLFKQQIERGGPVTVTHPEMTRFFMTIPEAVHLVIEAAGMVRGPELFALDMGEPVRIADLAEDLIRLSGFSLNEIPVVYTGMRPGEKLAEALWEANARVERTGQQEILRITEPDVCSSEELARIVAALRSAAEEGNPLAVQAILAKCLPTYVPWSAALATVGTRARLGEDGVSHT